MFSVLRVQCRGNLRESNCEASSYRNTEEYKEYNREFENEKWRGTTELWLGDRYGKLVVEKEILVSLWRLSVWLEDLVTMRLF
jgi:hypothetical protein